MLKIELQQGQQLFFTSDTHYNHKNICRGVTAWKTAEGTVPLRQTRDFDSLEQMNSKIVNNINAVVGQDDIVVHLGDWSFGGFEYIKEFRDRLVCKNIYLTYGNHDHHIEKNKQEIKSIFTETFQYVVLQVVTPKASYEFVVNHYPLCSWHDMNKGRMHLFGHVHLPPNEKIMQGRAMDVGMDGNNLKPYSLGEVVKLIGNRDIRASSLPSDHHEERLEGAK